MLHLMILIYFSKVKNLNFNISGKSESLRNVRNDFKYLSFLATFTFVKCK